MKTELINEICSLMHEHLSEDQNRLLKHTLQKVFRQFNIPDDTGHLSNQAQQTNMRLLNLFTAAKKIEGCSENTLKYYSSTLLNMIDSVQKMSATLKLMTSAFICPDIRIPAIQAR